MRYPKVSLTDAQDYIHGRREGLLSSTDLPQTTFVGEGDDCRDNLEAMWAEIDQAWEKRKNSAKSGNAKDAVEGELSVLLYKHLIQLPVGVLTDRDFWRHLSTSHFFEFIGWRDGEGCSLSSFGSAAKNPGWDCVPLRMFNRALIASAIGDSQGEGDFWASRVAGADLWRSHILRVLNGHSPTFVAEMLRDVKDDRLKTQLLRAFAKGAKRRRANVLFEVLDSGQAREIVDNVRQTSQALLDSGRQSD